MFNGVFKRALKIGRVRAFQAFSGRMRRNPIMGRGASCLYASGRRADRIDRSLVVVVVFDDRQGFELVEGRR